MKMSLSSTGIAMYILVEGIARYEKGHLWSPPGANVPFIQYQQLIEGDSFGEEIIFGEEEQYVYSVLTLTACTFHLISEDGFQDQYRNMPELRDQMHASFLRSRSSATADVLGNAMAMTDEEQKAILESSKAQNPHTGTKKQAYDGAGEGRKVHHNSALSRQPTAMKSAGPRTQKPYRVT